MKIKGVLLLTVGGAYLRQYTKDGEFRDLKIIHGDLSIEIDDESAIMRTGIAGEDLIDYSDEILGV